MENRILVDAGHVFDLSEMPGVDLRALGVRHEIIQDGNNARLRDVWYWIDDGSEHHADESVVQIVDLVHLAINTTADEKHLFARVRTSPPETRNAV